MCPLAGTPIVAKFIDSKSGSATLAIEFHAKLHFTYELLNPSVGSSLNHQWPLDYDECRRA